MRLGGARSPEPDWLVITAAAMLTSGPVLHYLFVHRYPFDHPEALLLPLAAAVAGVAVMSFARRLGGVPDTMAFAVLLYVFIDLQFDIQERVGAVLILAECVALSQLLRSHRAALASIMLAAFYGAALPFAGCWRSEQLRPSACVQRAADTRIIPATAAAPASRLPLLLHVILDEQWGSGGLRAAGDSLTAAFLDRFYTTRGFEVYPSAYSRWHLTGPSMVDLLSLGEPHTADALSNAAPEPLGNAYFGWLRARGYRLRVYQTTYLDFCQPENGPVESCNVVGANSIANFAYLGGSWPRRAVMAARYFLNVRSQTYVALHGDDPAWRRSGVGGALKALEDVRRDVVGGPRTGIAYFVHVLLPHQPVEVDAECRAWSGRLDWNMPASDSGLQEYIHPYGQQVRCAHRALDRVLQAIERAAGRDGAIIIVHGDHGSRLTTSWDETTSWADRVVPDDAPVLNAMFSTLLAIKRPGVSPAVIPGPVPIQDFLAQLVRADFRGSGRQDWRHYVLSRKGFTTHPSDTLLALSVDQMPWARQSGTVDRR